MAVDVFQAGRARPRHPRPSAPRPVMRSSRASLSACGQVRSTARRRRAMAPAGRAATSVGVAVAGGDMQRDRQGGAAAQVGQRAFGHHDGPRDRITIRSVRASTSVRACDDSRIEAPCGGQAVEQRVELAPRHRVEAARSARPAPEGAGGRSAPARGRRAGACPWNRCRSGGGRHAARPTLSSSAMRQPRAFAAQAQVVADLFQPGQRRVEGHVFRQIGHRRARGG